MAKSILWKSAGFALPFMLILLSGCSSEVLDPAGDIARQQRDIILMSTGLMLLIIVPVIALTIIFAWRYRKGGDGTYDPRFDHSAILELAIWSAPLLIIIALGALTWSSTHLLDPFRPISAPSDSIAQTASNASKPAPTPLVIQVVSLDWKWLFIYPEQGVATVNELVIPINRPVRFDITSSNMMNTFYVPTLAGMIYAMPGMQSQLNAILRRTGKFEGLSANYSGAGFSDMRFHTHGMDETGFSRWVSETKKSINGLDLPAYRKLAEPSERVPAIRYATVDSDLYRRILERCVDPGARCMTELMKHKGRHNAHSHGDTGSLPGKHEGMIFKNEAGSGSNITKPVPPHGAPGMKHPQAPKNRSQS